ncbi:hypothetical protein ACFFK0_20935 [Paenibacillus chartarius]|uniref:Prepilin type IV endopeptidase peptidase domain-containing protein n=1 Tax=Paenibacillus chartarius TaxID=747481 RepID=A0ABV6DQI0_9BACL
MNPGILSLVLLVIALILLASGWKDVILRSISHKGILLFFVLWLGTSRITVSHDTYKLNLSFILIAGLAVTLLLRSSGVLAKLHVVSIGLLLGSFYFLLKELLSKDPVLIVSRPDVDIAVVLGLVAVLLRRSVALQLACLSMGLVLGELYGVIWAHKAGTSVLGSASFRDQWWVALFVARGGALFVQGGAAAGKGLLHLLTGRGKGGE